MSCTKCGPKSVCGCKDSAYTTVPSEYVNCSSSSEPCDETIEAKCVRYTGVAIADLITISEGERLNSIIQKLILLAIDASCVDSESGCISVTDIDVLSKTNNSITPFWSLVSTAINYRIKYKVVGAPSYTVLPVISGILNESTITGLLPDTEYLIFVKAICTLGPLEGCDSVVISVKTLA